MLAPWLRCHPNHFFAGRFSSSATQSNSSLTTGLSGTPLSVDMAFAFSGDSLANCGARYFLFRPDSESGLGLLGPTTSLCIFRFSVPNSNLSGLLTNIGHAFVLFSEHAVGL